MKRMFLLTLAAILAFPVLSQTNFRPISYQEAVAAAKAENKMLFLDFYTSWCGPCKVMMRDVFPQKTVGDYFNAKFVCLKLDAEKEGKELAQRHGVKAYPTFVVLDANEKRIASKEGGNFDGKAFVVEIDRLIDPNKSPERLKSRYEGGERTPELIAAYAGMLMDEANSSRRPDRKKIKQAQDMVNEYFNGLSDAQRMASENLFIYTIHADNPSTDIAKYMIANRSKFDAPSKEAIDKKIDEIYYMRLYWHLNGSAMDKTEYQSLKLQMTELGLADKYAGLLKLIGYHVEGDLNAFISFCESEYKNLDQNTVALLMSGMANTVAKGDTAVKMRASKFIRSKLAEMDTSTLYFAVMQINQLENPKK